MQNRVAQAEPRLPEDVRRLGVTTVKSSPDLTMVVHLLSPNDRYDMTYLRNYALLNVKDRLARIDGVGQVLMWGAGDYSMRVWLDPQKVAERGLSATDVVNEIRAQNVQAAAGIVGASPGLPGLDLPASSTPRGGSRARRSSPTSVKTRRTGDPAGATSPASSWARPNMRCVRCSTTNLLSPSACSGAGLERNRDLRQRPRHHGRAEEEHAQAGLRGHLDPTQFVRASIEAVVHTLLEAVALVVLVVILFLQTWRASIIPLFAVPVSIIGTFAVMYVFGFSINALTLFGLVLAIGIVVDDAIVVVENVERNIEAGLSPRLATHRAMREVSGPIIAIALVLVAVFVPLAFISGLSGQFYKQFALTISISTVISAINSLTLSPALAAALLKGHDAPKDFLTRALDRSLGWLFRGFNRGFGRSARAYSGGVKTVTSRKAVVMGVYLVLIGLTYGLFKVVPGGFVPGQDKQYLVSFAQLPDGATLDRTEDVIRRMSDIALKHPGVESAVAFPGLSISGFTNSSNAGIVFVTLKPFAERKAPELSGQAIAMQLNQKFAGIEEAFIAIFPPPPVMGLGTIGGFKLQIEDRAGRGYEALDEAAKAFLAKAAQAPELARVFSGYQVNVPQLYADIDRTKARQLGVAVTDVFETLQIYLGSIYVTTSTSSGAPTPCACRPTRRSARAARTWVFSRCAPIRGRWCPSRRCSTCGRASGPSARCATTASSPPTSTAAPRPGIRRDRPRPPSSASPRRRFPRAWATNGPSSRTRRSSRAIRPCGCSRCRSSSCSWCSRRSTRAWCCRFPSSSSCPWR